MKNINFDKNIFDTKVDKMSTCGGGNNLASNWIHKYFSINNRLRI